MKRSAIVAFLLFVAVAIPGRADIGPWTVTRFGMTSQLGSATGGGVSVVVGLNGEIWSSPDGVTWLPRANPDPGGRLNAVTYGGGRFVAVGYGEYGGARIVTSSDGVTWTQEPVSGGLLSGVAYGNGQYVAVAYDGDVLRSFDGTTWTPVSVPGAGSLSGVTCGGGLFVAVGDQHRLLTSPDGLGWTDRSASVPASMPYLSDVAWTGSRFVVVGLLGIMTSPNGIAWTQVSGSSYGSVATNGAIVVAMGWEGAYATSPTGEQWTVRYLPNTPGAASHALTVSFGSGRFVAAGEAGVLQTSADGTAWISRMLPASRSLRALAHGGGRYCATGPYEGTAVSADGATWTNGTTGSLGIGRDVLWTGSQFVSVGPGPSYHGAIATSFDCVTWILSTWSLPAGTYGATFEAVGRESGGRLVAVGERSIEDSLSVPLVATSTDDGASWTAVPSGFGATEEGVLRAVAYGGGRWVASGWRYDGGPLVTVSTNGVDWTSPPPDFELDRVESLAYGAGLFVAAGETLWTSPDGVEWTSATAPYTPYHEVRFFAGQFVAVGESNDEYPGIVSVSSNGTTWTSLPQPRALESVAFTEDGTQRVVAVGDSIVLRADAGLPGVSVVASPATEASLQAVPILQLSSSASGLVTVAYQTANGSAVAPSDYEAVQGVATFPPGTTQQPIDVPLVADGLPEGNETFRLLVTQASGGVIRQPQTTLTIVDTPTIAADDAATPEGNAGASSAGLAVRLSHSPSQTVTVAYATGGGTATSGVDYTAASGTLTFAPGSSVLPVPVSVLGDVVIEPDETFTLSLSSAANASIADATADAVIQDDDAPTLAQRELAHGMLVREDFGAPAGADTYRVAQAPRASYEVVVDGIAGDAVPVVLERLAADNATVLDVGAPVGTGAGVSLRFRNGAAATVANQHVRVRAACATACGPDDVYRLRAYETTLRAPRFSNVGGQATLLVLQNPAAAAVEGIAYFWDAAGTLLHAHAFVLASRQTLVVNAASLPGLLGRSGSVTVAHTAPYGALAGKTVALEPTTGFGFDTPLSPRPR